MLIFNSQKRRLYLVDTGASTHLVDENSLTEKEKATKRKMEYPVPMATANGDVTPEWEADVSMFS